MTALGYDPNSNLTSVTDARNGVTGYIYNNMDRVETRRDQLLHDETYQYDPNGNLTQVTDRKSQITSYGYDPLNRLTQITYPDLSTTSFTYDGGNRLTQAVNSLTGTITFAYDNLDRLTSKKTPQGTISYTYDAAGRRTSMTVAGQSTVNYTYDNANRLTQITQGSATVTIAYDNANRRTSLTLPSGLVTEYAYDAASRLTGITYKYGANTLGNLTYAYDDAGRRTTIGGSYARSGLPVAVATASHNAANQQTAFGSQNLTYDLNGNLTSDGTNTYVWNGRDQLVSMTGPGLTASFQYDAFGKRISKTVNGATIAYLYDGANLVQEQQGGSPSANILAGGLDEVFTRTDVGGAWSPLFDGLGSTLALADSTGTVQTQYTYEPFGKTTASGAASSNSSQYTGRENDATGLHFNRARYYSPTLQRFISEDPIGLAGGVNLYGYVVNNPISFRDPFGFKPSNPGDDPQDSVPQPESPAPPAQDPCNNPYLNLCGAGGAYLMGGGVSLLANHRGLHLQLSGGTAFSAQIAPNGSVRSPLWRGARRVGVTGIVRASRSGISEGWGTSLDFGPYSRNWDANGNATNEVGLAMPGVSQQATYTFRFLRLNGCP